MKQTCESVLACIFCRVEVKRGTNLQNRQGIRSGMTVHSLRAVYFVCRVAWHLGFLAVGLDLLACWSINYVIIT